MNKQLLPVCKDRLGILYIDHAEIRQDDFTVTFESDGHVLDIPIATILCLILGPGTSITHAAIKQISEYGCSILWTGENMFYFYSEGIPLTKSSKNILKQCRFHESKLMSLEVIRRMYSMRYPEEKLKTKTLQELRGMEGLKMAEFYRRMSLMYHVKWSGRETIEIPFEEQSEINKAITSANQILYAITLCVINALGYSPAIGFIHSGDFYSFVYDISDLYKERFVLPVVFQWIGVYWKFNEKEIKRVVYENLVKNKIMEQMIYDLNTIFMEEEKSENISDFNENE